ncbi:MAG: hypothetical protein OXH47_09860, partial [Paracoccaceae bacterium]|nr:hypothetical protein [Paracoccaceae bacterium]
MKTFYRNYSFQMDKLMFQNLFKKLVEVLFCICLVVAPPLLADETDEIITSHGISVFGDLKYDENFQHFDYVNPNAPKGGNMSVWGFGTFDSLNPFIVK